MLGLKKRGAMAFGYNLFSLAKALKDVPGDLAVCGVYEGRGAHLLLEANPNSKWLYGFEPADASCEASMAQHGARFTLLKGEISHAFDNVMHKRFSFVHIDVEQYHETKGALSFFWPRMTPGGVIFIDDYKTKHASGSEKAIDEFAASTGANIFTISTGQAAIFKLLDYGKYDVPVLNRK